MRKFKLPMLRLLAVFLFAAVFSFNSNAAGKNSFSDETLHYVITYKWGLVHKEAGEAQLTLRNNGKYYDLKLTGKTKPWADKIYNVRDTLSSKVLKEDFKPVNYVKTAHEGGKYSKDNLTFSYSGNVSSANCLKYREKKGKISSSTKQLSASGSAYDMLSIFYYLRTLDYSALQKGKVITTNIFSGTNRETVKIRSLGVESVKMRNGSKRNAYHIKFNFTSDSGKKSSDDIDAWLSEDNQRIPLVLIGKLPIGSVRCYLEN